MATQHIETLIVGSGQAGLVTGYHLKQLGREFLIVDANDRIGDNWRCHYDSLTLFTPAKVDGLAGLPFPGEPWRFPTKDEMADYLELYVVTFDLPVRLQTRVEGLAASDDGDGFIATLADQTITCENVVIATGTFGRMPQIPRCAHELDGRIQQLHSSEYRRPVSLAGGPVLVVGASHSGLDIAYELGASRPTTLVGPARGAVPIEWGSRKLRIAFPFIEFAFNHVLTRRTPMGRKVMRHIRHHGGPQLRVKRHHLADRGVEWIEDHIAGVSAEGLPQLADGRTFDVATVVWATGFRQVYDWIDVPLPVEDGWPVEYRGVVEDVPGLFFCGLAFQYAFASGEMSGVSRDAAYIAKQIAGRTGTWDGIGSPVRAGREER